MVFWILTGISSFFFIFYMILLVYFLKGFNRPEYCISKSMPNVTVIVPAHNEERNLPLLLDSLSHQTYPKRLTQILLVDDRSTDRTYQLMTRFSETHPQSQVLKIRKSSKHPSPKKNAILKAVQNSDGEIIITTDADTHPGKYWIKTMVQTYDQQTGAVLGYAPYRTEGPYNTFFHRLLALEYFSLAAVSLASSAMGYPTTCNGANFSYRRKAFDSAGGFGQTLRYLSGDDDLFLHRICSKTCFKIRYAARPEAAVFTNPPLHFRDFFWQRIRFASKHLAYPLGMRAVLLCIYIFYCCLGILLVGSFFNGLFFWVFGLFFTTKTAGEWIFLSRAQRILEKRNLLKYYPFASIPHIFYVIVFPLLGQLIKPRWK